MDELPVELVHEVAFHFVESPVDVLSLALASKGMYEKILGKIGEENEYDVDQWRAMGGISLCLQNKWKRAAQLAVVRGYGDVNQEYVVDGPDGWKAKVTTPLCGLAEEGWEEMVDLLLADPSVDPSWGGNQEALPWACHFGHIAVVYTLLEDVRVDPSGENSQALRWAAECGHVDVVQALLDDGRSDPSADDSQALRWAAEAGHIEVVELLLRDWRVDPGARCSDALRWASKRGHAEVVEVLLRDGRVNCHANDSQALAWAQKEGHDDVVELLLRHT